MDKSLEKVVLPKFDKEKYFKDAEAVLAQRKTVEEVADKVCEEGFSNIVLLGIGGTEFELGPIEYQIKKYSNIDVELVNAADANTVHHKNITKDTLVITASASGDTVEIVEAAKWIVEIGAHVVAFTKKEKPLGQIVQTVIEAEVTTGGCEFSYVLFDLLAFRILHNKGTFPKYEQFAKGMDGIFQNLYDIRVQFDDRAEKIAKAYYNAPYSIFTGSGAAWGETILFAMCILEEMQWVRTRPVTSAQFFHGTLELVEEGVPVFVIKGEDEFRNQDTRVEKFLKQIEHKETVVIDTAEFALDGVDKEFRPIFTPMIVTALLTDRVASYYETYTKHNLQYRRYYRQFKY